jgi:hypothetical protein
MSLSRVAILNAADMEYAEVEVPEWGGTVRLRSITAGERDAFEASCIQQRGDERRINMRNLRAKLIVLCAVDEDGNRLFGDDDLHALAKKNARPLDRLFDAAQKLCGLSKEDVTKLAEDFDSAQSDA